MNSFHSYAGDLWSDMQWWPASWPEEQQNQLHRALVFSGAVCLALVVSHLSMTAYIAYHDLTGRWDKYSLKFQHNTVWTYLAHASSFFADVAVLLGPSLVLFGYYYDPVLWEPLLKHGGHWWRDGVRICALLLAAVINNIINRLWAMLVHWVMHLNKHLYQWVHRRHHCSIRELCALSAWQDTWLEFLLMEVLGVFLFAQLFNPLPWHFHVLLAAYNGIGGAIDHSAFYIPGTWIDGRYHWDHHVRVNYNYSEIEFLDKMFGTLYERGPDQEEAEPPRIKRKRMKLQQQQHHQQKQDQQRLWQKEAAKDGVDQPAPAASPEEDSDSADDCDFLVRRKENHEEGGPSVVPSRRGLANPTKEDWAIAHFTNPGGVRQ